jgi:hypothetical protein
MQVIAREKHGFVDNLKHLLIKKQLFVDVFAISVIIRV